MLGGLQVEDPSKYGVVVMDEDSQVERFVEKPKVRMKSSYWINISSFSWNLGNPRSMLPCKAKQFFLDTRQRKHILS